LVDAGIVGRYIEAVAAQVACAGRNGAGVAGRHRLAGHIYAQLAGARVVVNELS
jgi:hypothetical protein